MDRRERLDDPEESLRLALEQQQARLWTALPGFVADVDLTKQTVSVQPTVQGAITTQDGTSKAVNLPLLVDVPIVWPRAGGFALTFPVAIGDEVLVVFAARCIDAWWQNGGIGSPVEPRMHDLSDGFALLAPTSQPKALTNVQTDGVELRDEARDTFIKLTPGTIAIQGNLIITGNTTQTGDVSTTGAVTIDGAVTQSGGAMTSNGKHIDNTHTHGGVQTGPGNTGVPN